MHKMNEKLLDDGTMAANYAAPEPEKIQVSLSIKDDLSFPIERRGYETQIPRNVDDRAAVAKTMGETVERTARFLMGLSIEPSA